MHTRTLMFALALGVTVCLTSAVAQQVKNGTISGTLLSAGATVPANSAALVFTAPATGHFILTTFCGDATQLTLRGHTVGFIASLALNAGASCQPLTPGFAIPQGEILSCISSIGFPSDCSISGVLSEE